VTSIDTSVSSDSLSSASFDADLVAAIGSSQMASHHAFLFSSDTGGLAGQLFLVVDANGTAGYQAGRTSSLILVAPRMFSALVG